MKIIKPFFVLALLTIILSCSSNKTEIKQNVSTDSLQVTTEKVSYDDRRENLHLSVVDTIKKSASYFFSNLQTKDKFLLTIEPGMVKESKSSLQIITADNKVVYSQAFDSFYFVKWIYDSDTIPTTGGQEEHGKYMENYWKSITPKQYETYFKNSVDSFFTCLNFLDKTKFEELKEFGGNINDSDFLNEYFADTAIKLLDIICFDCDEGATVIGYSKKQNRVVTLFEHD